MANDENSTNGRAPEVRENGVRAYETLGAFLESDGWHPQANAERFLYRMMFAGQNGEFRCYAQIRADLEQFIFYAVSLMKVPEHARASVAEFVTRANYAMRIGNFELDLDDGEVRFKSSLDFEGEALTSNWIRNAIAPAVQTLDRYLPGIMAVSFGGKPARLAVKEIEG